LCLRVGVAQTSFLRDSGVALLELRELEKRIGRKREKVGFENEQNLKVLEFI